MFIVFEGIDGSGKTTQMNKLLEYIKNLNNCMVDIKEFPDRNDKIIKTYLSGENKIDPITFQQLNNIQRFNFLQEIRNKKYINNKNKHILVSRWYPSGIVYGMCDYLRDNTHPYHENTLLTIFSKMCNFIGEPDIGFVFLSNIEEVINRIKLRKNIDIYENAYFLTSVYNLYKNVCNNILNKNVWHLIDTTDKSIEKVFNEVLTKMHEHDMICR